MSLFNKDKELLTQDEVVDLITDNFDLLPVIRQGIEIDRYLVKNTKTTMPDGLKVAITYLRESMRYTDTIDNIIDTKDSLEQLLNIKDIAYDWYNIIYDIKHNPFFTRYKKRISRNKHDYTDLIINLAKIDYSPVKRMITDAGTKDNFLLYLVHGIKDYQEYLFTDNYALYGTYSSILSTKYSQLCILYENLMVNHSEYGYFDFDKVEKSLNITPVIDKDTDCSIYSKPDSKTDSKDDKQELADIVADKVEERLKKYIPKQTGSVKSNEDTSSNSFVKVRITDMNRLATMWLGYKDIVCLCHISKITKNDETYFIIYKAGSGKGFISSRISKEEFIRLKKLGLPYCIDID